MSSYYASGIILLPAILLSLYASNQVKATFDKYSKFTNRNGYTGLDIARRILDLNGLFDVSVEPIKGRMTDHYDPKTRTVRLSETVYSQQSLSAISVAAHECGHAIQHQQNYVFLGVRHTIVPVVNFANQLAMPLVMIGAILGGMGSIGSIGYLFIQLGILFFIGVVFFQFVTLPVEFNASKRALYVLEENRFLTADELEPAKKVLRSAALTYVAAAASAVLSLLRLIMVFGGRRND